jgi:hypothetical protein
MIRLEKREDVGRPLTRALMATSTWQLLGTIVPSYLAGPWS